jgi:hypothetical protein
MSLYLDLKYDADWLRSHEHLMGAQRGGYMDTLSSLDDAADQAKELEALVKQAHELLSGEWDPDDVDRAKFMRRLERAIP